MNKKISILSIEHPLENILLRALFVLLGALFCAYLYFVGASVLNIIDRKEASAEVTRLQSTIAGMEKEYFVLTSAVGPLAAVELDLTRLSGTDYVYRPGNAASADTIERNEI